MNDIDSRTIRHLVNFILDKDYMSVYNGRWDKYFSDKKLWNEYFHLVFKTDEQLSKLLELAKNKAKEIQESSLYKALNEETPD